MILKTYIGKDNRVRYYAVDDNGNHRAGSYPRILMEESLGRPLEPDEDVHHKDGNPLNNDLSNLEVVKHGEHQRAHSIKYANTIETCLICGAKFEMTYANWSRFYVDIGRGKNRLLTCSRSCASKASSGAYQFKYNMTERLNEVAKIHQEYLVSKSI